MQAIYLYEGKELGFSNKPIPEEKPLEYRLLGNKYKERELLRSKEAVK